MFYFGRTFTSTTAGDRLAEEACESCGGRYAYRLARVAAGRGHAPYLLGQAAAKSRAAAAAERNLAARLASDADLVPCPACHWVNAGNVDRYRRRMYPRGTVLAWALAVAGGVTALITWAALSDADPRSGTPSAAAAGVLVATAASAAAVLFVRRQLRRLVDPNATYPRWPTLPPGTPPSLVEVHDPLTGIPCWIPAPRPVDVPRPAADGVTFRSGQFHLPDVCGGCLGRATTRYRPPLRVNASSDLAMPMCAACLRRYRRRWWSALLGVFAGTVLAGAGITAAFPRDNVGGGIAVGVMLVLFGTLLGGVVLAGRVARPYRLTVVDGGRGVYRFTADNPAYTALVADHVAGMTP